MLMMLCLCVGYISDRLIIMGMLYAAGTAGMSLCFVPKGMCLFRVCVMLTKHANKIMTVAASRFFLVALLFLL